jgi:hypothetical protein
MFLAAKLWRWPSLAVCFAGSPNIAPVSSMPLKLLSFPISWAETDTKICGDYQALLVKNA